MVCPEVLTKGFDETLSAAVAKYNVVPFDGRNNEGGRKDNTPGVVTVVANKVSAMEVAQGEVVLGDASLDGWVGELFESDIG